MKKSSTLLLVKLSLASIIGYSLLALIFHIRWFVPFIMSGSVGTVPDHQLPVIWFPVQIASNIIFLVVGYNLIGLFIRYQKVRFFDTSALRVFNLIIGACILFAVLQSILSVSSNFKEVHLNHWNTMEGALNLAFRTVTKLLVFQEPQSLLILLAVVIWAVKQFVIEALELKIENDSII
ncbi:hypothetical protein [Desertivirga brevis]|uniref:hypothetical protein n=1 Tax=Desertivirga brevis TaxID=2810310 RepID=UPI001A9752A2|nr:hypothetical protein [Pedobacter sp. SYSU D00873]